MLTKNEKMLIADTLNGCNILLDCDPHWLASMRGSDGALADAAVIGRDAQGRVLLTGSRICSGLELEIYDAIRLNAHLDEKWQVDGAPLLEKIRALTPDQREQLVRAIAGVWQRNDANFERDLEAVAL